MSSASFATKTSVLLRDIAQVLVVGVGVTMVGLVVGAVVVSPIVTSTQRLLGIGALAALAAALFIGRLVVRAWRRRPSKAARQARQPAAATGSQRGNRRSRTPRAVQALAASGAAPTEIAWKTGLPVDAVSMLLELSGSRVPSLVA